MKSNRSFEFLSNIFELWMLNGGMTERRIVRDTGHNLTRAQCWRNKYSTDNQKKKPISMAMEREGDFRSWWANSYITVAIKDSVMFGMEIMQNFSNGTPESYSSVGYEMRLLAKNSPDHHPPALTGVISNESFSQVGLIFLWWWLWVSCKWCREWNVFILQCMYDCVYTEAINKRMVNWKSKPSGNFSVQITKMMWSITIKQQVAHLFSSISSWLFTFISTTVKATVGRDFRRISEF